MNLIRRASRFVLGTKEAHAGCTNCLETQSCNCKLGVCIGKKFKTCCNNGSQGYCYWSSCYNFAGGCVS